MENTGEGGERKGLLAETAEVCHVPHIKPVVGGPMGIATEFIGFRQVGVLAAGILEGELRVISEGRISSRSLSAIGMPRQ